MGDYLGPSYLTDPVPDYPDVPGVVPARLQDLDDVGVEGAARILAAQTPEDLTAAITEAVEAFVAGAPGALDTLNELAAALNDDASFAATVTTALAGKAPLASPALTGTPTKNGSPLLSQSDAAGTYSPISSAKVTITRNPDGTVATVTETDTGAVTTYTYNTDGTLATEARVLGGVTTTRTFTYTSGNLSAVA